MNLDFFILTVNSSLISHLPICLLQSGHSPGFSEVIHAIGHMYTNFCSFLPVAVIMVTLFWSSMPHIGHDLGAVAGSHSCGQIQVNILPDTSTGISLFSSFIPHTGQSPSVFDLWHSMGHTYTVSVLAGISSLLNSNFLETGCFSSVIPQTGQLPGSFEP